jgi:hypothetical protein
MPYIRRMTEPLHNPNIDERINPPEVPNAPERANPEDVHEGAKDEQVSDRIGPGAGYDQEPEKTKDKGGVS